MSAISTLFHELLFDGAEAHPARTALIDDSRSLTYEELAAETGRIAGYLLGVGVVPGQRVIVHLRKSVAEVAAMLAISKVGAVVVNVNWQWTVDQLCYVAQDCTASLLIVEPRAAELLSREMLPTSVARTLVAGVAPDGQGFDGWDAVPARGDCRAVPRLDSELAMIIYTSGSTGKPKGVMLSHRNILAGARAVARYLRLGADDRLLSVLPYSFDYGLNQLTTMLLLGGMVIHQPVPMAAEVLRAIRTHGATGLAAVPPLWGQLIRLLEASPVALPTLRRVTNSGGKIPRNILERMPDLLPSVDIYLMYGLTEAFRSTYLDPAKFAAKMGSIGSAIPSAEVHVIKAGEGVAGLGEQGELVHRGPLVSLGYWGNPEATRAKIRPCPELRDRIGDEPVVYSGDIVRIDAEGDLWFVGRNDALIKSSGFRISPDEVEDLICRSGLVSDAVAFGVDDEDQGQVVHVAVAPLPGFDEAALMKHCRSAMPHYMVPRRLHVWRERMPLTASGKIARPEVIRISSSVPGAAAQAAE